MIKKYADKKIVIIDNGGLYTAMAEKLAESFGKVYYICPNYSDYNPSLPLSMIGERLKDVKVIEQWKWKWNDYKSTEGDYDFRDIDLFVFPFIYFGDEQMNLTKLLDKTVWGSRKAEELELLRFETKVKLAKIGLAVTPTKNLKNYAELIKYLTSEEKERFIKLSWFRGVAESGRYEDMDKSVDILADLKKALERACADEGENAMEIIAEDLIESDIEYGIDTHCIDGEIPNEIGFGMEIKSELYVSTHVPFEKLHKPLKDTTYGLCKLIKEYGENGCRSFVSTEVRLDKKGQGHLIDITMRSGVPPTEMHLEWIENYAEIMYEGAKGNVIEPIYKTKYAAQLSINSIFLCGNRQDIKIPNEIKQWVKLNSYCGKGKKGSQEYSVIPNETKKNIQPITAGSIVGLGNTPKECFDNIHKYAEMIEGEHLEYKWIAIDDVMKELKKLKEMGIKF